MSAGCYDPLLVSGIGLSSMARIAETAGFDGISFTDHPIPSSRWLAAGGHEALDPFSALAFCAAATEKLRLITNVVVLPYRNPFVVAKAAVTVDLLSEGRLTLGLGAGYLRAEFRALGVDPAERNELFDEALDVLLTVWASDDVAIAGRHFSAPGNTARPQPVQRPHPPLWIGGNSARARERVVRWGQGWNPFPVSSAVAPSTGTAPLQTSDDLRGMLDDLWERLDAAGRSDPVDVHFVCPVGGSPGDADFNADAHLEGLKDLAAIGVTWVSIDIPGDDLGRATEAISRYGEEVIRKF